MDLTNRVVAARVKRVTAKKTEQAEPKPFSASMPLYGLEGVIRTTREKTARRGQERR
jgi:hypothetical protein